MSRLTDRQDAHGHAMYDAYLGKPAYEVDERDDGFVGILENARWYLAEYEDWSRHERKAIAMARGRVLDVGCGAGRNALYLQRKGLDVLGIDISPLAIKTCKLRGLKHTRVMSITQVGPRLGTFDTILMYGNNFGLFGGFERARSLLRRFHRITSDRARIIAETVDPYATDERCHKAYHKWNKRRGRMGGQIRLRIRYQTHATPWFDYLLVSKREMRSILAGTGWRIRRFFDSRGPGYVVVIEKVV